MNEKFDIELNLDEYHNNSYLTHNFHPYPAKFIPQIPKEIILKKSQVDDWILDPFCGSGTTLVEAKIHARNSIGVDINPLSTLISKVKTTFLSPIQIQEIKNIKKKISDDINNNVSYPIPHFHNIDHWFKKSIQHALAVVKYHIENIVDEDVSNFLKVAFSSIIVKVSNQESDTRYAAVEKNVKPSDVVTLLNRKINDMCERIVQYRMIASNARVIIFNKDSTKLDYVTEEVSLALTSPPYMNSYDYYLYHKHRMNWLGMDYKWTQEKEFGSRNKHNDYGLGIEAYKTPIRTNALNVKKILKNGGYYCVVVGDAILKGELIRMNVVFDDIFEDIGYNKIMEFIFDQRKYTRAFTRNIKKQYKNSYILIYQN